MATRRPLIKPFPKEDLAYVAKLRKSAEATGRMSTFLNTRYPGGPAQIRAEQEAERQVALDRPADNL